MSSTEVIDLESAEYQAPNFEEAMSRVVFDTAAEVRLETKLILNRQKWPFEFLLSEIQVSFANVDIQQLTFFLNDRAILPGQESLEAYVGCYCFVEMYRKENGLAKTEKRVILEYTLRNQLTSMRVSSSPIPAASGVPQPSPGKVVSSEDLKDMTEDEGDS